MPTMDQLSGLFRKKSSESSKDDESQQPFLPENIAVSKGAKIPSSFRIKHVVILIATAISSITILGLFYAVLRHPDPTPIPTSSSVVPDQILECGTSASEARSKGCVFDVMNYAWIPTPCFNKTLSDEYWEGLVSHGIEFWSDASRSELLSHEDILAARHEYSYTSWLLHLKHCQYLIHRQLQCLTYGTPVDNVSRNISHAEHCLEEVRSPGDIKTMLFTGTAYLKCAQGVGDIGPIYWNDPPKSAEVHPRLL
ncbi:hypothetical protein ONS95_009157 [Cadophora gregata]|uniref:uncharacterized protein n=1 Tax=Cadophora gregata TaxID=51156 RepID=UPI0026DC490C|nr:uncharacterized protein ONS95_009157 [Cadophora gregata]KAK0124175.1 hypothetical protein ONS95_009157 [Cadophora gregata]KAK0130507.1 hypothetical protein ONS96_001024 [Cadophora gregata f. sp. sojae]